MDLSHLLWRQPICKEKLRERSQMHLEYLEITPGSQQPFVLLCCTVFSGCGLSKYLYFTDYKLVLDLMSEICPFICAFFPSSSYLKKKKKDQHHKSFCTFLVCFWWYDHLLPSISMVMSFFYPHFPKPQILRKLQSQR